MSDVVTKIVFKVQDIVILYALFYLFMFTIQTM